MDPITYKLPHTPQGIQKPGEPVKHISSPAVTGSSVLGIKYKDGLMFAADCLGSYGSMLKFKNQHRLHAIGKSTVLAFSGDVSDFQYMQETLDELMNSERNWEDDQSLGTKSIYSYIHAIMYQRRSKVDPLWNSYVVGGIEKGKPFMGYVDLYGTTYEADSLATGFGKHLAQPLMRKALEDKEGDLTEEEARDVLLRSLRVLFYRDTRSLNLYQIAKVTGEGVTISDPTHLDSEWEFGRNIRGYGF
ncbi:Proteasome subunit beta type-7 [Mycoemilia scoparia]|uniref:Proteasome subunit beta n=1 Tax=Mycoemilia scoparia TaxID=417184 RepID=A0A9W8DQB7_9FUNG|nr:Proteasome subunit beta type-7 [Mycoemilia scoparia]